MCGPWQPALAGNTTVTRDCGLAWVFNKVHWSLLGKGVAERAPQSPHAAPHVCQDAACSELPHLRRYTWCHSAGGRRSHRPSVAQDNPAPTSPGRARRLVYPRTVLSRRRPFPAPEVCTEPASSLPAIPGSGQTPPLCSPCGPDVCSRDACTGRDHPPPVPASR